MKKLFSLSFLIVSFWGTSQTHINQWNISLNKDVQIFPIKNQLNDQVSLCFYGKHQLTIAQVDETMVIKDSVTFDKPEKNFIGLEGYSFTANQDVVLYWRSNNSNDVLIASYDFVTRKNKVLNTFTYPKTEYIWDSFTLNNEFYFVTVIKNSNLLNVYKFESNGTYKKNEIDFSTTRILDENYKATTFHSLLKSNASGTVEVESMVSLLKASKEIKKYQVGESYIITLDHSRNYTQILTINLSDFSFTSKVVNKPAIPEIDSEFVKSNSFVLDGKLFQYKVGAENLAFQIDNLKESNPKIYYIEKEKPITWKNSEIIQEMNDGVRILEKSNQLINKMNNMNNDGVSVYKLGENYLVTLGVVSEEMQSGGAAIAGSFGFIGVVVYASLSSNATYNNFMDYSNRKVVYIHCLFDKDGNHLDAKLNPLAFEQIQKYFKDIEKHQSITMFRHKGNYIVGSFDKKQKTYFWKKFTD